MRHFKLFPIVFTILMLAGATFAQDAPSFKTATEARAAGFITKMESSAAVGFTVNRQAALAKLIRQNADGSVQLVCNQTVTKVVIQATGSAKAISPCSFDMAEIIASSLLNGASDDQISAGWVATLLLTADQRFTPFYDLDTASLVGNTADVLEVTINLAAAAAFNHSAQPALHRQFDFLNRKSTGSTGFQADVIATDDDQLDALINAIRIARDGRKLVGRADSRTIQN